MKYLFRLLPFHINILNSFSIFIMALDQSILCVFLVPIIQSCIFHQTIYTFPIHVICHHATVLHICVHLSKNICQNPCLLCSIIQKNYLFFILKILSFIFSPIFPGINTFSMHLIFLPITIITSSITPFIYALIL